MILAAVAVSESGYYLEPQAEPEPGLSQTQAPIQALIVSSEVSELNFTKEFKFKPLPVAVTA